LIDEDVVSESWNRKSKRQKTNKSYLMPNPLLRHLNLNKPKNIKSFLLKNGFRADELKSCAIPEIGNVILTNTCAFDTLVSLFMTAYCDSVNYRRYIDENIKDNNIIFDFILKTITKAITATTYSSRAKIIINYLHPVLKTLEYNTTLVECETTMASVIKSMLQETPTVFEFSSCSNSECKRPTRQSVTYITYQTSNENIHDLQLFLDQRMTTEGDMFCCYEGCTGIKTLTPTISTAHIVIEILYWNSK